MADKTRGIRPGAKDEDAAQSREKAAAALARFYDIDLEDDPGDLDMYLAFSGTTDGPILELMAGSGRLAVPIAAAGHRVTAVDLDPHMLARATTRWKAAKGGAAKGRAAKGGATTGGALELIEADVTGLVLGKKRFDLIFVALNSLLLLNGRDAQRALFQVIARHLTRDGRAVIDVWLPAPEDLALYDGRLVLDWFRHDRETGERVAKSTAAHYDSGTRTAHVTSFFDSWREGEAPRRVTRDDDITFVSVDELQRFATDAGLEVNTIAGDYEMGHFTPSSERVVMVCNL